MCYENNSNVILKDYSFTAKEVKMLLQQALGISHELVVKAAEVWEFDPAFILSPAITLM